MRIAITGASGQLGQALVAALGQDHQIQALTRAEVDIEQPAAVEQLVATEAEVVIHPAAYTNVDGCARDPEKAYHANALGTKHVALACRRLNAPLVYVSTNEVFDGTGERAYYEYDHTNPINAYGWSKWCGEQVVRELLDDFYIARVAWLYGGERNFVRTVLRLANERPELGMVEDEVGSPTHVGDVATALEQLLQTRQFGTYHIVNEGSCSRYEFAAEALRLAGKADFPLKPIKLADFKRDSVVPPFTPLRNEAAAVLGIKLRPWQAALAEFVAAT